MSVLSFFFFFKMNAMMMEINRIKMICNVNLVRKKSALVSFAIKWDAEHKAMDDTMTTLFNIVYETHCIFVVAQTNELRK